MQSIRSAHSVIIIDMFMEIILMLIVVVNANYSFICKIIKINVCLIYNLINQPRIILHNVINRFVGKMRII